MVVLSILSTGLLYFPVFFFHSPGLEITFSYNILYQSFMLAAMTNEVSFKGHLVTEIAVNLLQYSDYLLSFLLVDFSSIFLATHSMSRGYYTLYPNESHTIPPFHLIVGLHIIAVHKQGLTVGIAHEKLNSYVWMEQ